MTALGGGILGWLDDALRQREHSARLAESEGGQQWSEDPFVYGVRDQTHTLAIRARENRTSLLAHIALHDPESVLRRCAADRKLMLLHGPCSSMDRGCKGCGFDNQEESMVDDYEDCPVLRALAEGYGWTEGER